MQNLRDQSDIMIHEITDYQESDRLIGVPGLDGCKRRRMEKVKTKNLRKYQKIIPSLETN